MKRLKEFVEFPDVLDGYPPYAEDDLASVFYPSSDMDDVDTSEMEWCE